MKTPEEIKKGLEFISCTDVTKKVELARQGLAYAYYEDFAADALAYIQQLEMREWDLFVLITSAWFGKQLYFQQNDGTVYSRASGEYMSFDQAIDEFAHDLTCDRECAQAGKETNVPHWTSVYTQMPNDGQHVLAVNGDGVMEVLYYDKKWPNAFCGCGGLLKVYNITHWMPLPGRPER